MIPRYTRPEMASIWEPQTRFKIWFEIEAHAADAQAELGVIPKEAAKTIWAKAKNATFDVARIDEIERETKHDVIAFLTHLAEIVGPEARFVHQGMTSSDVLDTCFNVQLTRAADLLISDIDKVLAALKKRAFEHKMTPTIGRSHGIHAEPVTFGLKLAYAYAEFSRARERLLAACEFRVGLRELQSERHRLGMDAVRAADGRRHLVLEGTALERLEQLLDIGNQDVGSAIKDFKYLHSLLQAYRKLFDAGIGINRQSILLAQFENKLACLFNFIHGADTSRLMTQHDILGYSQGRNQHKVLMHHTNMQPDSIAWS